MAGRYKEAFKLKKQLYLDDSPIIIEAGAIQIDTVTNKVIGQLKLRNIQEKRIVSCKAILDLYEVNGDVLDEYVMTYSDLEVAYGQAFGSKTPIYFNNDLTRLFSVCIVETVYEDLSVWRHEKCEWKSLEEPCPIDTVIIDKELLKQWEIEAGPESHYLPVEKNGLCYCTCGRVYSKSTDKCFSCNRRFEDLLSAFNLEKLEQKKVQRIYDEEEKRKDEKYKQALYQMSKNTENDIERAISIFESIAEWKDSKHQIKKCKEIIEELRVQSHKKKEKQRRSVIAISIMISVIVLIIGLSFYFVPKIRLNKAYALIEEGDYEKAYEILENLGEVEAIAKSKYDRAVILFNKENFKEAYALFKEINYKDSKDYLERCELGQLDQKYSEAIQLLNNNDIEEALVILQSLGGFKDSASLIEEYSHLQEYNEALILYNESNYEESYKLLQKLGDYKDCQLLKKNCLYLIQEKGLRVIRVGSTVKFGSYEQDNDLTNGEEEIEWIVLEIKEGRALLLSTKVLEWFAFGGKTWEKSAIRKWLNNTFYDLSFGDMHKNIVLETKCSDEVNEWKDIKWTGTYDHVFLLSKSEVNKYMKKSPNYSISNMLVARYTAIGSKYSTNAGWYVRTPGIDVFDCCYVDEYGEFNIHGDDFASGIRPAIWIDIHN